MAKKPKLDPFDFSNEKVFNSNPEAMANWERYQTENDPRNREAKGWAFIEALVNDGVELSDTDQINILNDFIRTGNSTFSRPDFSNVESSVSNMATASEPSLADRVMAGVAGTLPGVGPASALVPLGVNALADKTTRDYGQAVLEEQWQARKIQDANLNKGGRGLSAFTDVPLVEALDSAILAPFRINSSLESTLLGKSAAEQLDAMRLQEAEKKREAARAKVETLEQELGGKYAVNATLARNVAGVAAQPEQLLTTAGSLAGAALTRTPSGAAVGGAALSTPMMRRVYAAAIEEADQWPGMTDDEKHEYGVMQMAAELGPDVAFGVFGAGLSGLFSKWGPTSIAKDAIKAAVQRNLATKLAALGAGGGVSEVAAELAGEKAQEITAGRVGDSQAAKAITEDLDKTRAEGLSRLIDPAVSGVLMSNVAAPNVVSGHMEQLRQADHIAGVLEGILNSDLDIIEAANIAADMIAKRHTNSPVTAPVRQEMPVEQKAAEEDAAWEQRNLERAREQNWEEARIPYENAIDLAREDVEILQEAVEEGARDSQTLNDLTSATTRLRQAEDALANFEATRPKPEAQGEMSPVPEPPPPPPPPAKTPEQLEAERVARVEQGMRIEEIRKRQQAAAKKALEEDKKQRQKVRKEEAARRNKIIDEVVAANPDATPAELDPIVEARLAETEEQAAPVIPERAAQPKAAAPTTPPRPITKSDDKLIDSEIEQMAEEWNLGMTVSDEKAGTPSGAPIDIAAARKKNKEIARALVRSSHVGSRSVQQLIAQGKLRVVPTAQSIGRDTNNVAEYDVDTGQMFIYSDKLADPSNSTAMIARALHEATHAGQFNSRDGRSSLYRQFLGDEKTSAAAGKIRKAAANGNKLAQRALTQAQADTKRRGGRDAFEDLEVVGYFTSEVAESRGTTLGSVGGVVRDITTAARSFMRDNLGLDLDVSIGDLNTAASGVGFEIAQTDISGRLSTNPAVLGMIYNVNESNMSPGQQRAIDEGWVYDSVDGTRKFVLSDHEATISPEAVEAVRNDRTGQSLSNILKHPVLYDERPEAANVPVYTVDSVLGTAEGMYDPSSQSIYLRRGLANDPQKLKEVLIHEVQHYVQDADGRSGQFYDGNVLVARKESLMQELENKNQEIDTAARTMIDAVSSALPARERGQLLRQLMRGTTEKDTVNAKVARDFVNGLENVPSEVSEAIDAYEAVRIPYNEFARSFNQKLIDARKDYLANITEAEAHFVEDNVNLDTTGTRPEPEMRERVGRQLAVPNRDNTLGMAAKDDRLDVEELRDRPMFRGNPEGTSGVVRSSDGALGPGVYLTSSREGAGSYGPVVEEYRMDVYNPLVITMEEVRAAEGNTAMAIASNAAFADENFHTRGQARGWAREQWEEWAGIGDEDFISMLRDAGFDSVVLMDGDTIVEANVLYPRAAISADDQDGIVLGMAAVDTAAADYDQTNTPAFKKWFGNSQVANRDGSPRVMYHGTRHYFDTFRPNRLGLIFVSPDQMFAEAFAGIDDVTPQQRGAIPLYIRAENVWHYDNPDHRQAVLDNPEAAWVIDEMYRGAMSPEGAREKLAEGDWSLIEEREVVEAIKAAGFDALTVYEGGQKNTAVFDPNQLKHATDNKGAWSREDDSILGMADTGIAPQDAPSAEARKRYVSAAVTSIFRNDKGLGEKVLNLVELAKSSPAYESMAAETLVRDYQNALDAEAVSRGIPTRDLSREIANKLEEAAKSTEKYSENKAAWESILTEYGSAGEVLMNMRNRADRLSMEMLRMRREQGGDLSPSEQREYKAILANLGRYVHRMYATNSGKAGDRFSKSMWDAYQKSQQKDKTLNAVEKQNAAVVDRALKVLVDDLVIPDDATLAGMNKLAVERLYNTWVSSAAEGLDTDVMRDRLSQTRSTISSDRINNQAKEVAKDLLGLLDKNPTTPLGKFYRGNKLDRGILQKRMNIAPEIRELMGEIRDPGIALLGTIGKQAEFVARNKLLLQLRDFAGSDLQPPNSAGTPMVVNNKMTPLVGEGYGPLEGWYASPNMHAMLDSTVEQLATFEQALNNISTKSGDVGAKLLTTAHDKWMKGASITKALSILGNPMLFGINLVGSFDTMLMNGNYTNPTTQLQALQEAAQLIAYAVNPAVSTEETRLLAKYGVIDSAQIGDIKNMNYKQIQKHIESLIRKQGKRRKALNVAGGMMLGYKEMYAMMDVWAKIANFHQNVNDLTAFNEAEGNDWSQDEIYQRASAMTKRLNISYQRAAPFIKALERNGITMFGTYFYETFRVQVENIAEVGRDLNAAKNATTTEGRNIMAQRAAKRTMGIVASNTLKVYAMQALSKLLFGDDEEKWYNIRGLLPDFLDEQDFIPVGRDENGEMVMFPISRIDPMGPNTDLLRQLINGKGDPADVVQQLLDLYIAPRIGGAMALAGLQALGLGRSTREPTIQQLMPGMYGNLVNLSGSSAGAFRAMVNVAETALPGITNSWRNNNVRPVGTDVSSQLALYSTYAGNRLYKLDPNQSIKFAGYAYVDFEKEARQELKDYFASQGTLNVNQVQGRVADIVADEKKEWDKLRRIYLGMKAVGMSNNEIAKVLNESPLNKNTTLLTSIRTGNFKSTVVSVRSLQSHRDGLMKGKSEKEKKKLKEKWDMAIKTLEQVIPNE